MSIDFTNLKTLTIPEGNVKKITDSTGGVRWSTPVGDIISVTILYSQGTDIKTATFEVNEGMTWGEFVTENGTYFAVESDGVITYRYQVLIDPSGVKVIYSTDIIEPGEYYTEDALY